MHSPKSLSLLSENSYGEERTTDPPMAGQTPRWLVLREKVIGLGECVWGDISLWPSEHANVPGLYTKAEKR